MSKITPEIAREEVSKWLDYKRVGTVKREQNKDSINKIAEAISDGSLILEDKFIFVQTLKFPTEGEASLTSLRYRPRIQVKDIQKSTKGATSEDPQGIIIGYICTLTAQPLAIIQALDSEDYGIAQAIAVFFL